MANWSERAQRILGSEDFEARMGALFTEATEAGNDQLVELIEVATQAGDVGIHATDMEAASARDELAMLLAERDEVSECEARYAPGTILEVELTGGDVGDSWDAICVDCDLGSVRTGAEWRALVRADRLEALLHDSQAQLVGSPRVWEGDCFGDGTGGTVERQQDGSIAGDGLNAPALLSASERRL